MAVKKSFQELEFKDAFLFAATLEDEEICRGVLERLLGMPIRKVKVHSEKMLLINPDYHGIRMDVYADDEEGTVFDVEMQTTNKGDLPGRSRYYQAQMDAGLLKPGRSYKTLPKSFVIFLCTFDPFGRGYWRYIFEERCIETGEPLGDGTCKVFLNTKGKCEGQVPEELERFLVYVGGEECAGTKSDGKRTAGEKCGCEGSRETETVPADSLIRQIDNRIAGLKRDRRMEVEYMLFGEMLDDERKEGYAEGWQSAENRILTLIDRMQAEGLAAEIPRLNKEPEFLKEMYKRFQLDK